MITLKTILNPFTGQLQKILDKETIAEKTHNHNISDINGLYTILDSLIRKIPTTLSGGYFAE